MLPLLRLGAEREWRTNDAAEALFSAFGLSEAHREQRTKAGIPHFQHRTHWAVSYLVKAGLLERRRRGHFNLTDEGRRVLEVEKPERIDLRYLRRYPAIVAFTTPRSRRDDEGPHGAEAAFAPDVEPAETATPEERMDAAMDELDVALRDELASRVQSLTPDAFEQLIVDLMVAIGYGAGGDNRRIGKSGDGGVDGIISEDRLGLDVVYLQAKRYAPDNKIGSSQIREFIGSLAIRRAAKGVFVTTSSFTASARQEAEQAGRRLVLIDGERLADLMIRHDVGVRVARKLLIKEIDLNFFDDA